MGRNNKEFSDSHGVPYDAHEAVRNIRENQNGFGRPQPGNNPTAPDRNPLAVNATFRVFPSGGGPGVDHPATEVHAGEVDGVRGLHIGPADHRRKFVPNSDIRHVQGMFEGGMPDYQYDKRYQRRADED